MPDGLDKYLDQFKPKKKATGDDSVARVLDDEFAKLGYGDTARLSILGDVGRENSWDRKTIFGGHDDPKNKALNRGIISWQGDRRTNLDNHLKKEGVLGRGDDEELRGMARFMDRELQSKEFAPVRQKLMNARGTYEASEALRKYVKYVPDAPYNSPDDEFRVKNNATWAKRARSLGLAQKGLDDYLDNIKGGNGGLDSYLDQFIGGTSPGPTNPGSPRVSSLGVPQKPLQVPGQPLGGGEVISPEVQTLGGVDALPATAPQEPKQALTPQQTPIIAESHDPQADVKVAYDDFLKQTGLENSQKSVDEFNLAQQTSAAVANEQNKLAYERDKVAMGAYNAERQKELADWQARQPKKTSDAQSPDQPVNAPQDDYQDSEYALDLSKKSGAFYSEEQNKQVAANLANELNVPFNVALQVVKQYPLKYTDGGGDVTEEYLSEQAKSGVSNRVQIGADVKRQVVAAGKKAKERDEEFKGRTEQFTSELGTDEPASLAPIRAAFEMGFITPEELLKRVEEEKDLAKRLRVEARGLGDMALYSGQETKSELDARLKGDEDKYLESILKTYPTLKDYKVEQDRLKSEYKYRPLAIPIEAAKNFYAAVPKAVASILKTSDMATNIHPIVVARRMLAGEKAFQMEEGVGTQIGDAINTYLESTKNKDLKDMKALEVIPDTLGQVGTQIVTAVLTGGATVPVLIGASMGAAAQYDDARKFGATDEHKALAMIVGGAVAVPDALLFMKGGLPAAKIFVENLTKSFLARFGVKFGEKAAKEMTQAAMLSFNQRLAKHALAAPFEAGQEFSENKANNWVASLTYDPSEKRIKARDPFTITEDDAWSIIGGFIGGGGSGVVSAYMETNVPDDRRADFIDSLERKLNEFEMQGRVTPEESAKAKREIVTLEPAIKTSPKINQEPTEDTLTPESKPTPDLAPVSPETKFSPEAKSDVSIKPENIDTKSPDVDALDTYLDQIKEQTTDEKPAQLAKEPLVSDSVSDVQKPLAPVTDKTVTDEGAETPTSQTKTEAAPIKPRVNSFDIEPFKPKGEEQQAEVIKAAGKPLAVKKKTKAKKYEDARSEAVQKLRNIAVPDGKTDVYISAQIRTKNGGLFNTYEIASEAGLESTELNRYKKADVATKPRHPVNRFIIDLPKTQGGVTVESGFALQSSDVADAGLKSVADDSKKPDEVFHSRVGKAIKSLPQEKWEPEALLKTITNVPGIKPLDPDLQMMRTWLEGQKGKVSRSDVREFVEANGTAVEETLLFGEDAKFETVTLPGEKENYREELLNLPASLVSWKDGHSEFDNIRNPIGRNRMSDRQTDGGQTALVSEETQLPSGYEAAKMPAVFRKYGEQILLKKMLHRAAAEGYDFLGITTGQQQLDRSDLSNQIDAISYKRSIVGGSVTSHSIFDIALEKDGKVIGSRNHQTRAELERVIGKDATKKIIERFDRSGKIKGKDLVVGGDNLAFRYDRKYTAFLNRYLKPYGVQIEPLKLADGQTINGIRITPEMKTAFAGQTQPLLKAREGSDLLNELKSAHTEDILAGQTGGEIQNNDLELSEYDAEDLRRVAGEKYARENNGKEMNQAAFDGITWSVPYLRQLAVLGRDLRTELVEAGYTEQQLSGRDKLYVNLDKLADINEGYAIAYVYDDALPEEQFHKEDLDAGRTTSEAIGKLKASPFWKEAGIKFNSEYPNLSDADKASEIAAKLATGQAIKYGWDETANFENEKQSFLETWADGIVTRNADIITEYGISAFAERFSRIYQYATNKKTVNGKESSEAARGDSPDRSNQSSGETSRDRAGPGPNAETDDAKERLRSLPSTLREAGIDADDASYSVFGNKDSIDAANALIADLGLEKAIKTVEASTTYDKTHAVMSFMLQRALRNEAAKAETGGNLEYAHTLRERGLELASRHAELATQAGQFTQAAAMVADAVESVLYRAQKIADKRGRSLTPVEYRKFEELGLKVENQTNDLDRFRKDIRNLKAQIKRLHNSKTHAIGTRVNKRAIAEARKKLPDSTDLIKQIKEGLRDQIEALRMVAGNVPLHSVVAEDGDKVLRSVAQVEPTPLRSKLAQFGATLIIDKPLAQIDRESFYKEIRQAFGNGVDDILPQIFAESFNLRQKLLIQAKKEIAAASVKAEFPEKSNDEITQILKERETDRIERREAGNLAKRLAKIYSPTAAKQTQDVIEIVEEISDPIVADYAEKILLKEPQSASFRKDRATYREAMEMIRDAHAILRDEKLLRQQNILGGETQLRSLEREEFFKRDQTAQNRKEMTRAYRRLEENPAIYYGKEALKLLGESRSILASGDLSGSLRQGFYGTVTNPLLNLRGSEVLPSSFGTMLKTAFSLHGKEHFADAILRVENHPNFDRMKQMGIEFGEAGGGVAEENVRTEYLKQVPGVRAWLGWSERTYAGFLDVQRALWAESVIDELESEGVSFNYRPEVYKAAGDLINIATGRGNIGQGKVKGAIETFGGVLFAPRFVVSRAQLLKHVVYGTARLPPYLRKIETKRAMRFHTAISLPMLALIAAGLVSVDPDDDDFLKIRVGEKARYETTGGLQQYIKLLGQFGKAFFQYADGQTNEKDLKNKLWFAPTNFLSKKLAPVPSYGYAAYKGKEPDTTEFNWLQGIWNRVQPIIWREMGKGIADDGLAGALLTAPTIFGIGVGYYSDRTAESIQKEIDIEKEKLKTASDEEKRAIDRRIKALNGQKRKIENPKSPDKQSERSVIDAVTTYAEAIGTDPMTAFKHIYNGQKIRRLDNGAIIIERMTLEESQKVKRDRKAVKGMRLDHKLPLQLGGGNDEENLELVTESEWKRYTPIENLLGKALRSNRISKDDAQRLIREFKMGAISAEEVNAQILR